MNENYYLEIGGPEAFSEQMDTDLSPADVNRKRRKMLFFLRRGRTRPFLHKQTTDNRFVQDYYDEIIAP